MKAKKSFGQHFLNQPGIARRIADALILEEKGNRVLEVGPGTGMLTQFLMEKGLEFKAVDADKDMVTFLEKKFPALANKIIFEDFLKLDLTQVFENQQFTLIGNFPYNISSQIIFKMIEYRELIPQLVGMFQKEVAERIVAKPGGKDYGVLTVLTQAFYEGKYLFGVDKKCFNPPPKVQSAVIRLVRKNEALGCDEALFRTVVKTAFGQRRKMLRNTMKTFIQNGALLENDFFKKRPEQLSLSEFVWLANLVEREARA